MKIDKWDREAIRRLRRVCRCGETFGQHGAVLPYTIGDKCDGFVEQTSTKEDGR